MSTNPGRDRDHWNTRYGEQSWPVEPSPWLVANEALLPSVGAALDVAGGTGRNAIWLAQRGWTVTIADVSDVALAKASVRAGDDGLQVNTLLVDLTVDPLPDGPWNLIALFHYLDRDVFAAIARALAPGGILIGSLATIRNLERNPRPPLPYLLETGELPDLIRGIELVAYDEGWKDDHHDARFVARRPR